MAERGRPIDLVTVTEELKNREALDKVGGAAYLASLAGAVPTAVNAGHYANIVADKGLLRYLINSCTQLASRAYEEGVESEALLDDAERMIMGLAAPDQQKLPLYQRTAGRDPGKDRAALPEEGEHHRIAHRF